MCNFEIPKLLFYTHVPAFVASFLLGLFIYYSDRKNNVNKNIFWFILLVCFWIIADLFPWLSFNVGINLFFVRIIPLVSVSLVFFLIFSFYFEGGEVSRRKKIILFLPAIPIILFLFSDFNAYVSDPGTCTSQYGIMIWYVAAFCIFYTGWSVKKLIDCYRNKKTGGDLKEQIKIVITALSFLVFWFLLFVFLAILKNNEEIYLFIPVGIVIFIGMLTYAITKYQFLNIKLISAQALTYSIWILIASQYFFVYSDLGIMLLAITLVLSIVFGIMLIRTIKEEIKRKEELQIMADRLAIANDELRKLDNAKTEFISIASHQLRTPLTAIKGFVSLLLEGAYGEVNPEAREAINKIHLSGERLIRLVEDLLNVSRIEAGRMIFEKKPGQLEDVVKEICEGLEMLAREKNLYLDWKLPKEKLPSFDFDASKMKEVVSSLVENAIKYSDKGGVTVRVERTQQTTNDKSQDGGNQEIIRFTVSDTGIGIPADEIPNLFKKFSRGKNTKRLNATGTGLGLFVVKNIVENHGGKIWIESKGEGMGTKFVVELPVANAGL